MINARQSKDMQGVSYACGVMNFMNILLLVVFTINPQLLGIPPAGGGSDIVSLLPHSGPTWDFNSA